MTLPVGVLALQGDFREHLEVFQRLNVAAVAVRTAKELSAVSGLVIPGGESTTIAKLARIFEVFEPIRSAIASGLPVFGTCAGLIMLADEIVDGIAGQESFGGLDVTVQRNAFGNQQDSFEVDLSFEGIAHDIHAAFIRAPIITRTGKGEVLATLDDGRIVAVSQDNLLGISFHPEMTGEDGVHELFVREFVK